MTECALRARLVWCGAVRCGVVWCGVVWCGGVGCRLGEGVDSCRAVCVCARACARACAVVFARSLRKKGQSDGGELTKTHSFSRKRGAQKSILLAFSSSVALHATGFEAHGRSQSRIPQPQPRIPPEQGPVPLSMYYTLQAAILRTA
jgi:hypothetical protein